LVLAVRLVQMVVTLFLTLQLLRLLLDVLLQLVVVRRVGLVWVFLVGQEALVHLQMSVMLVRLVFRVKVMPLAIIMSMPQGMPQVAVEVQGLLDLMLVLLLAAMAVRE
jgi:hypothetical protein